MSTSFTPGPWSFHFDEMDDAHHITSTQRVNRRLIPIAKVSVGYTGPVETDQQANARLIAAAPDLLEALKEGRRAIGDHFVPDHCYATGPLTGDPIRDLVECPACSFIAVYDRAIAKAEGR